jgi:6,7-dimethyl-8-ribityllumazine synthase
LPAPGAEMSESKNEPAAAAETAEAEATAEPRKDGDTEEPFEGWPSGEWSAEQLVAPETVKENEAQEVEAVAVEPIGHVVEEGEAGVHELQHVGGEIDVPAGYAVIEGQPTGERRSVGVVVSRFNGGITNQLLQQALATLAEAGVAQDAITVMPVPGAFELPLGAMALAKTRRYACIVALGCVIRGETPHFDFVANEAASGLQLAAIETGVPVAFGVLTVNTIRQAEARIDKATEAVQSALEMADAFAQLRASAKS